MTQELHEKMVVSNGKRFLYGFPLTDSKNYFVAGAMVLASNYQVTDGLKFMPLVHEAFTEGRERDEPEFQLVQDSVSGGNFVHVYNRVLRVPSGIFVVSDPTVYGFTEKLYENSLYNELNLPGKSYDRRVAFSKDGKIRFAQNGTFRSGVLSYDAIKEDGLIIAQYGVEGADQLAEIIKRTGKQLRSVADFSQDFATSVSSFGGVGNEFWSISNCGRDSRDCMAFKVNQVNRL